MRRKLDIIIVLLVLGCAATGRDLFVTPPGYGAHHLPYTNWADAATNIQSALSAAVAGDRIWVTNGWYAIDAELKLTNGIILRSYRDGAADNTGTVVDAQYLARCVSIDHSNAVVDGFTLMRGSNNQYGGAVYMAGAGGLLTNCVIRDSTAKYGGGVYADTGSLWNCHVVSNSALYTGGGIYAAANFLAVECKISHNLSATAGGVELEYGSCLQRCAVVGNLATNAAGGNRAGGVQVVYGGALVRECVISNNTVAAGASNNKGGGIVCGSNGVVEQSLVVDNWAPNAGAMAAGVYVYGGGLVRNCTISGNSAIAGAGGAWVENNGTLRNCLVVNNGGASGGGVHVGITLGTTILGGGVESCTIVSNWSSDSVGGLYVEITNKFVSNCIIASNQCVSVVSRRDVHNTNGCAFCCCPSRALAPGAGNITFDPVFVAGSSGNYRLQSASPCIGAGSNAVWMAESADLDGRRRVDVYQRRVDIGAYEFTHGGAMVSIR